MGERLGFINDKLDIKLLILFVLRRLPAEIDMEELAELVLIDGGVGYFDYKECLAELMTTAQVEENGSKVKITAKGLRNEEILENDLPYSVRHKAELTLAPVAEEMRRSAMIHANHEETDGGVMVYLSVSDGIGTILDMKILTSDTEQAKLMEGNFRKKAEEFYHRFVSELCE
ncbi:MAG: DUF4364 family protein [Oscillospiraceae bacterium]|nr:DUF4364 family protein [Oscillospiraceae bacterium]